MLPTCRSELNNCPSFLSDRVVLVKLVIEESDLKHEAIDDQGKKVSGHSETV